MVDINDRNWNQAIWKYELAITDYQTVAMPEGAEVLFVEKQQGILYLWAKCTTKNPVHDRGFWIVGTGHPLPYHLGRYIGSVVSSDSPFVWHVFEDRT